MVPAGVTGTEPVSVVTFWIKVPSAVVSVPPVTPSGRSQLRLELAPAATLTGEAVSTGVTGTAEASTSISLAARKPFPSEPALPPSGPMRRMPSMFVCGVTRVQVASKRVGFGLPPPPIS